LRVDCRNLDKSEAVEEKYVRSAVSPWNPDKEVSDGNREEE